MFGSGFGLDDIGGVGDWRMEGPSVRPGVEGSILSAAFGVFGVGFVGTISRDLKTVICHDHTHSPRGREITGSGEWRDRTKKLKG